MDKLLLNDKHLSGFAPHEVELHEVSDVLLLTIKNADRRIGASGSILLDKEMALEIMSYLEMWVLEQAPVE